jgi:hypothetical protein
MPDVSRVQRLRGGRIRYRGRVFPGFNKPRRISHPKHKGEVLAKVDNRVAHLRFGSKSHRHNYSPDAKRDYLRRSGGIRDKSGQLTRNNKLKKNYWSRSFLWSKNTPTTSEKRLKRRAANMARLNRLIAFRSRRW